MVSRVIGLIGAVVLALVVGFLVRANQMSSGALGANSLSCSGWQEKAADTFLVDKLQQQAQGIADQCSTHADTTAALWGLGVGVVGILVVLLATRRKRVT